MYPHYPPANMAMEGSVLHLVRWFSQIFPFKGSLKDGHCPAMCYRKSPCPSLRLATTPCNSCTKANIPMPISQVPTSTAESTASYGKLRCDKHNRDGDIMFTSWDMYGYVILRYNGDTMRIYTVDICWLWLWSALARYGMYVYIYIYSTHKE